MPSAAPAQPEQVADAIGLALNRRSERLPFPMRHGLSAKYVDAWSAPTGTAGYSPDDAL